MSKTETMEISPQVGKKCDCGTIFEKMDKAVMVTKEGKTTVICQNCNIYRESDTDLDESVPWKDETPEEWVMHEDNGMDNDSVE